MEVDQSASTSTVAIRPPRPAFIDRSPVLVQHGAGEPRRSPTDGFPRRSFTSSGIAAGPPVARTHSSRPRLDDTVVPRFNVRLHVTQTGMELHAGGFVGDERFVCSEHRRAVPYAEGRGITVIVPRRL